MQDSLQTYTIHSAGITKNTSNCPSWPANAHIHWVLQPQQASQGKTIAAFTQEKPYLAAKAMLDASAQLQCDSKQLLLDYHRISAYQIHWYAIKKRQVERTQRWLAKHHRLHVIEPCTDAIARALHHLLPQTHHQQPIMALQRQRHALYITRWQGQPWQCTMHQAMTHTQAKQHIMTMADDPSWLWIDDQQPTDESAAWHTLRATLPRQQAISLPTLATLCNQPCQDISQDLNKAPWLALYGSMLRRTPHGH